MKHAFVLVAAMLAATAHAQDDKFCNLVSRAAASTMQARQNGAPMADIMEAVSAMQIEAIKKLVGHMIVEAYETPRYQTERIKADTVSDFRDRWHLRCVKAGL